MHTHLVLILIHANLPFYTEQQHAHLPFLYLNVQIYLFLLDNTLHTHLFYIKTCNKTFIYVAYSRPYGWTEWTDIFCGHSWVAGGC